MTTATVSIGPVFTFDAVEHIYRLDGVEIPGVTKILKSVGLVPNYGGFGDAQWRGLHVHNACELLDLNDLDWSSIFPNWVGYVQAYDRFKVDTGFTPELIEFQTYHPVYRYGGTMDRRGKLNGWMMSLDLKTGVKSAWHPLQTAGYKLMKSDWKLDKRAALYLHEDGSYTLDPHDDPSDEAAFLSAVALYHWKRNHRLSEVS